MNHTPREPVDTDIARDTASYTMTTYTYIYQASHGSPEVDHTAPNITRAVPATDGLSVRLYIDAPQVGHVHELHLDGIRARDGLPLLHSQAYYTLNYIPKS
jgi:hypothetical protein